MSTQPEALRLAAELRRLRAANAELAVALAELHDRIKGHPEYADLSEEEEEAIGGDCAEFSYLVRTAAAALSKHKEQS